MKLDAPTIIVMLVLGWFVLFNPDLSKLSINNLIPSSTTTVTIKEPSADVKEKVQPVKDAVSKFSPDERKALVSFYHDGSIILAGDPNVSRTYGQFRTAYIDAGKTMFTRLDLKKHDTDEKFGKIIDGVLMKELGNVNKTLSAEDRTKLVNILDGIAWACN